MSTRWVCDFFRYEGATPGEMPPDEIQCPVCGEPITPLASAVKRAATVSVAGCSTRPLASGQARRTLYRDQMDLIASMTALLDNFYGAVEAGDVTPFNNALAADVIVVGTDEAEWWQGREEALRAMRAQFAEMSNAGVRFTGGSYQIVAHGDAVWAVDRPTVHLADGTATPLRMTAVATNEGDHLVVQHMHLSAAAPNEEIVKQELTV